VLGGVRPGLVVDAGAVSEPSALFGQFERGALSLGEDLCT
jgi:hypothetical protein